MNAPLNPGKPSRGTVNWETVERILVKIDQLSPTFLEMNVLIGGGACYFYRQLLVRFDDAAFPPFPPTPERERLWLSKDIDVIGTPKDEIPAELGLLPDKDGNCFIDGVLVDSPDVAYMFDANMARSTALRAVSKAGGVSFLVASPALLLREKRALLNDPTKERPQDAPHAETLERSCKVLLCRWLETRPMDRQTVVSWRFLADEVKEYAPDLLNDPALVRRLKSAAEGLKDDPHSKSAYHWVKHKVPGASPFPAQPHEGELQQAPENPKKRPGLG